MNYKHKEKEIKANSPIINKQENKKGNNKKKRRKKKSLNGLTLSPLKRKEVSLVEVFLMN